MKTVRLTDGTFARVSNEKADELVSAGEAKYAPKISYKTKDLGARALEIHRSTRTGRGK